MNFDASVLTDLLFIIETIDWSKLKCLLKFIVNIELKSVRKMDTVAIKTAPPHAPLQQQQPHSHLSNQNTKQPHYPILSSNLTKSNSNCSSISISNFHGIGNTDFYPKSKNVGAFFQICKVNSNYERRERQSY